MKPSSRCNRSAFTRVELIVLTVIVLMLCAFILPTVRQQQSAVNQSKQNGIAVSLKRIETAKQFYVAEHHLKTGDMVAILDLKKGGFLQNSSLADNGIQRETGVHFVAGRVGVPVEYHFESDHDKKHQK